MELLWCPNTPALQVKVMFQRYLDLVSYKRKTEERDHELDCIRNESGGESKHLTFAVAAHPERVIKCTILNRFAHMFG